MQSSVKVIDLFKTSIGDIAVLAFVEGEMPRLGMILKNRSNFQWTVSGIGRNRKSEIENKYTDYKADAIWDCVLKPLNHSESPIVDDVFEIG